jgi:hypothetical protein
VPLEQAFDISEDRIVDAPSVVPRVGKGRRLIGYLSHLVTDVAKELTVAEA